MLQEWSEPLAWDRSGKLRVWRLWWFAFSRHDGRTDGLLSMRTLFRYCVGVQPSSLVRFRTSACFPEYPRSDRWLRLTNWLSPANLWPREAASGGYRSSLLCPPERQYRSEDLMKAFCLPSAPSDKQTVNVRHPDQFRRVLKVYTSAIEHRNTVPRRTE